MQILKLSLSNKGEPEESNRTKYSQAFMLNGLVYTMSIKPKVRFWTLGLSFLHQNGSDEMGEKTVFFDIKPRLGSSDADINDILLLQSQFLENPILTEPAYFNSSSTIELFLQYSPEQKVLHISYKLENDVSFLRQLPLEEYDRFRIFATSVEGIIDIDLSMQIFLESEMLESEMPFKVRNITVRRGDIFDQQISRRSDLLVIPASSSGEISLENSFRAIDNGVPVGIKGKLGTIEVFLLKGREMGGHASYAFTTNENGSSIEIIESIFEQLENLMTSNRNIRNLSIPLIGSGSGGLGTIEVFDKMLKAFSAKNKDIQIYLSLDNPSQFQIIREYYQQRIIPLPFEFTSTYKPEAIKELEEKLKIKIGPEDFRLAINGVITELVIKDSVQISDTDFNQFRGLRSLTVANTAITSLRFLERLEHIRRLYIRGCRLGRLGGLQLPRKLEVLDLSDCHILSAEELGNLTELKMLILRNNSLHNLRGLQGLRRLEYLDLSRNGIQSANELEGMGRLRHPNLSDNHLLEIDFIKKIKKLVFLDISNNSIREVDGLLKLKELTFFRGERNLFEDRYDLKLMDFENHLTSVKNYLLR